MTQATEAQRVDHNDLTVGEQYRVVIVGLGAVVASFVGRFVEVTDDGRWVFDSSDVGPDQGSWWIESA
jgi:hypothetical protein